MSSNEESEDEFESADEDLDCEPPIDKRLQFKSKDLEVKDNQNDNQTKSDQMLPQFESQLNLTSIESKKIESIDSVEENKRSENSSETITETRSQTKQWSDIKREDKLEGSETYNLTENKSKSIEQQNEVVIKSEENQTKGEKIVIKTRKLLRKADRFKAEEQKQDIQREEEEEEKHNIKDENKDIKDDVKDIDDENGVIKIEEDIQINIKREENKTQMKCSEIVSEAEIISKCDENNENKANEKPIVIKGRKLLRKADRLKETTDSEESEISEQKKNEVLNKLSDLSERDDSSYQWNNWFSDIKSAAMTATSTTANHVSQASSKWSLNPKSLLTSAVSITSNVGSGISSVVENVSSVVDSAIGAPPPEQMAALANKDSAFDKSSQSEKQNEETNENPSKSSLGFGLFDYTLNTLESIGKKTMEVIVVDEKPKRIAKTDKKD